VFPQYLSYPEKITPGFDSSRELYAIWGYNVYVDKTNTHGYATVNPDHSPTEDTKKYVPGESVQFNANIATGYKFKSWGDGDTTYPRTKTITENYFESVVTEPLVYSINYNMDGGTNHPSNPSSYTIETPTINLGTPTKDNHIFLGWSPSGSIPVGSYGNKTFTATWKVKELLRKYLWNNNASVTAHTPGWFNFYYSGSAPSSSYYYTWQGRLQREDYWCELDYIRVYINGVLWKNITGGSAVSDTIAANVGDVMRFEFHARAYGKATDLMSGWWQWIYRGNGISSMESAFGNVNYSYYG